MWGLAISWDKANERTKRGQREPEIERVGGLRKRSPARLITSGSKFPVNHFYNTQAILLKEEAIRRCPTFHLRLTFMSSTQFYHSECNAYRSSDAVVVLSLLKPCRPPNHLPEGQCAPHENLHLDLHHSTDLSSVLFHAYMTFTVLFNKWSYFYMNRRSTCHRTGHWRAPNLRQSNHLNVPAALQPIRALWSKGEDL